ncbi:MAG TPA: hypothetical protein VJX73_15590, partial [Terracidiphilus sp.]|nr:hypothetical protein [Terracidiphilus sp.]
ATAVILSEVWRAFAPNGVEAPAFQLQVVPRTSTARRKPLPPLKSFQADQPYATPPRLVNRLGNVSPVS